MPSKKQSADDKVNQEAQEYLRKAGGLESGGRRTRGASKKVDLSPEKPIKKVIIHSRECIHSDIFFT